MENNVYDVIIVGSGPAGLTAAIYTTRANLKTLIIAGAKWGGQLQLTTEVENFPGFPEGIQGPDLMLNMRKQAERLGAEIVDANFIEGDFTKQPFTLKTVDKSFQGKAVILATGADTKWLDVKGEKERIGRGISTCAPCDAPFFRKKKVIVVGGGDSAMEEALVLTRYAEVVYLIHRGNQFRASKAMQDKVFANEKIHVIYNTVIDEIKGENRVQSVLLKTKPSDTSLLKKSNDELEKDGAPAMMGGKVLSKDTEAIMWEAPIDGIFVAIGHIPNTQVFKGIELDEKGFIKVQNHFHTNVEGVFTAGDVHDRNYKQAITAAGFGCASALEVERWLEEQKG